MGKETCLVTGGAGFIGCAISARLVDEFSQVVVLDNLHSQIHAAGKRPAALHPRAELVVGDVTSQSAWDGLLSNFRPNVIIHLAAETGTAQSLTAAERHSHVNLCGLTVMLDAIVRHEILPRRIFLASSRAVYGEGAWRNKDGAFFYPGQRTLRQLQEGAWEFVDASPIAAEAELTQPRPVSIYGATKLAQEHILKAWGQALSVPVMILRLQNVYGPGQSLTNPYTGIVPLFCQLARLKQSIPLYEDGAMKRDFVFIDDVAEAILKSLRVDDLPAACFDVGTGLTTTVADLAQVISAYYSAPPPSVCGKFRLGDVRHAFCDITRSRRLLSWAPEVSISSGLDRLSQWLENELPQLDRGAIA